VYTKGATELVAGLSTSFMTDSGPVPLSKQQRGEIFSSMEQWAEKGYRTLGIAMKEIDAPADVAKMSRDQVEKDLVFLGFVMIADPLRPGVKKAVESCESAGVKVVMITGDHPRTAKAIGSELGIWKAGDKIIEGNEITTLADQPVDNVSIFARVDPRQKDAIVRRYQGTKGTQKGNAKKPSILPRISSWLKNENEGGAADRVVAMTGDGVNDALALGMADVGIAMGISGTAIAKEAADMIITDDSFNTIELGIREGRALFAKIRTIIYFFIYTNLVEASFLFATSFIPGFTLFHPGGPEPWFVDQVFLIVGLSHAVPPLGLTFDRTAYEIMTEKPRNEEEIFNKNTLLLMLVNMAFLLVGFFIAFGLIYPAFVSGGDLGKPRTIALGIVMSIEIFTIFSIRRPNLPVWRSFRRDLSPILLLFTIFAYGNFVAAVYIPLAGGFFFSLQPLAGTDWLLVIGTGLGAVFGIELAKWLIRKYRGPF
jgi:P-type Ca2+ transporter type 2C